MVHLNAIIHIHVIKYSRLHYIGTRLVDEGDDTVEFTTTKDLKVYPTFESLGLKEDLLRGIYAYGRFHEFLLK